MSEQVKHYRIGLVTRNGVDDIEFKELESSTGFSYVKSLDYEKLAQENAKLKAEIKEMDDEGFKMSAENERMRNLLAENMCGYCFRKMDEEGELALSGVKNEVF